jgi:hypothetical protein
MDPAMRKRAGKTAVDGFTVVERIYRHTYQTLMALKDTLKTQSNLKVESPLYNNPQSTADPKSWIYHFRGLYLASKKISLEEYGNKETPILFIQASLHNPDGREPVLRYGVIEKIFNMSPWKGVRFDDYFRMTLVQLHTEQKPGDIKTSNCEVTVRFDEKALLDLREDKDIVALAGEIGEKYAKSLLG